MYMRGRLLAIRQRNDMWMLQFLENLDLRVQVFLQLPVELVQVDGFDGNVAGWILPSVRSISMKLIDNLTATIICDSIDMMNSDTALHKAKGRGDAGTTWNSYLPSLKLCTPLRSFPGQFPPVFCRCRQPFLVWLDL